jgi:hypothetical protein
MSAMDTPQPENPNGAAYYDWEPAGKGIRIHLNLVVVDGIRQIAFLRNPENREVGGLLVGHSHYGGFRREIWIEDFLPIRLEHLRSGTALLPGVGGNSILRNDQEVLGYYRTHNRTGGLFLDDSDIALLHTHFNEPNGVVLAIRPSATAAGVAGFFFWEGSHIRTESSYLEFPFRRQELQGESVVPAHLTPVPGSAAVGRRTATAALSSWLWLPFLTATLVLVPLLFYKSQQQRVQTPTAPPALALTAERTGSGLKVTWNRSNPVVRDAQGGTLWITDGGTTKRLDLDAGQVSSGSIVYWPTSQDLNFKLQVFAPGRSAMETVRAVGPPALHGEEEASAKNTPPPPPATAEPAEKADTIESAQAKPSPGSPYGAFERNRVVSNRDHLAAKEFPRDNPDGFQQQEPARTADLPPPPEKITPAEPVTTASITPPPVLRTYRPTTAFAKVSYEPIEESRIRKAIAKVPGLSLLQRHRYKSGDEFTPARPVKEVTPTVPITLRKALGNDEVNVDVRVEVDSNGQVKKLEAPESSRHADFVKLASDSAKHWKFEPARLRGKQVSSNMLLHFRFVPGNR